MKSTGILVFSVSLGFLICSSVVAALPDCNKVCLSAAALFKGPSKDDMDIYYTSDGGSNIYITWTSNDPAVAPMKFSGMVNTRLRDARFDRARLTNATNGCDATIELIDRNAGGEKTYYVPIRNVLCEEQTPPVAQHSK